MLSLQPSTSKGSAKVPYDDDFALTRGDKKYEESAAIAQRRRHCVDRQLNAFAHARVVLAGAVPLEQLDLQEVQGFDIRQAQPDRRVECWVLLQQASLLRD